MNQDRHEEVADEWLNAALVDLRREVPANVDWDGLHHSIHDRAELVFARRRKNAAAVRRPFIPLALAAGLALMLWSGPALLQRVTSETPAIAAAVEFDSEAILREALGGDLTEQEFDLLVTGRAYPEVLLAVAIDNR
jgi:hypothetical protein